MDLSPAALKVELQLFLMLSKYGSMVKTFWLGLGKSRLKSPYNPQSLWPLDNLGSRFLSAETPSQETLNFFVSFH